MTNFLWCVSVANWVKPARQLMAVGAPKWWACIAAAAIISLFSHGAENIAVAHENNCMLEIVVFLPEFLGNENYNFYLCIENNGQ